MPTGVCSGAILTLHFPPNIAHAQFHAQFQPQPPTLSISLWPVQYYPLPSPPRRLTLDTSWPTPTITLTLPTIPWPHHHITPPLYVSDHRSAAP